MSPRQASPPERFAYWPLLYFDHRQLLRFPGRADGRIYLTSTVGKLTIVKAGRDKPKILYQADFGERIFARPALVEDKLHLRRKKKVYAFGAKSPGKNDRPAIN